MAYEIYLKDKFLILLEIVQEPDFDIKYRGFGIFKFPDSNDVRVISYNEDAETGKMLSKYMFDITPDEKNFVMYRARYASKAMNEYYQTEYAYLCDSEKSANNSSPNVQKSGDPPDDPHGLYEVLLITNIIIDVGKENITIILFWENGEIFYEVYNNVTGKKKLYVYNNTSGYISLEEAKEAKEGWMNTVGFGCYGSVDEYVEAITEYYNETVFEGADGPPHIVWEELSEDEYLQTYGSDAMIEEYQEFLNQEWAKKDYVAADNTKIIVTVGLIAANYAAAVVTLVSPPAAIAISAAFNTGWILTGLIPERKESVVLDEEERLRRLAIVEKYWMKIKQIYSNLYNNQGDHIEDGKSYTPSQLLKDILRSFATKTENFSEEMLLQIVDSTDEILELVGGDDAWDVTAIAGALALAKESPKQMEERLEELKEFYEDKGIKLGKDGLIAILTGLSLCNEYDYDEVIECLNQVLCYLKTHRIEDIPDRIIAYIMGEIAKCGPGNVSARMIITELYDNEYIDYFPKDEEGYPKDWVEPNIDTDGDGVNDGFDWDDAVDVYEDDIEEEDMEEDSEDLEEEEEEESQTPDQIDDVIIEEVDGDGD